jgi:DNA gyrase subunit A
MEKKERIIKVNIEDQMKSAYIDYSMSVIVSRALPDVRDGMKPVHRRILYAMMDMGLLSNRSYKKSARIVGEVLGKYHPHGDSSVYDAMVRMAQEWSLRYPLVDGQGNFGSIDNDSPAAMRYTEARLKKLSEEILADINKDTVDFKLNFDDSLKEPTVLPTRVPNLLINGASGIAVGMATNMAPHNLTEVINGAIAYIDNNDITIDELMTHITAPDFPTGGIIYGYEGVRKAFETGRGRIVMRGEAVIEEKDSGRTRIIVSSVPYQVNKADMIKKTADLVNDKKIDGISDIRDESDRNGLRVVYDLKRDAIPNIVLNKLYQYTALQSSFSVNNIALVNGRPELLNLYDLLRHFVDHRHEVVIRRTKFELKKAEDRAHILEGLIIASDNIDEVISIIRSSKTPDEALNRLIERFELSDIQARAIVDMRLRQLTGLEQDKLRAEYEEIQKRIADLKDILANKDRRMAIIKDELIEIKENYGDERYSKIEYSARDFDMEDMIPDESVVITISHLGYIKRTSLTEYRRQGRGGKGSRGSNIRGEDFLEHLYVASNHNYMLLFTDMGKVYWLRVFEIPEGTRISKGRALQNMIQLDKGEKVMAFIRVNSLKDQEYINNNYIILSTKRGTIKKTTLEAYSRPRTNGIHAINIREGDELLEAKLTSGSDEIILATKMGRAIRFNEKQARPMGRTASGVRGVRLASDDDEVIGMIVMKENEEVLVVSEKGYGKRSSLEDYRVINRGGKGVKTLNITDKTGSLIAIKAVLDDDDLMIITQNGILIRMAVSDMRIMGRATQGVRLINLKDDDKIGAVARVEYDPELEDDKKIDSENTNAEEEENKQESQTDTADYSEKSEDNVSSED